ncbi:F-box only protein 6 isoform X2 [Calliopsis andreniformis]|uniref:F-box only protein 6 isoform X2 n=1 Tax=Calliopsis andreniformis TaxID=337506 RepID=UPI003FCEE17A
MGEFYNSTVNSCAKFDKKENNGLILCNTYLPEELLAEIFCYVTDKSLLNCQLVCKRWKNLIQSYVWRKKAEITFGRLFLWDQDVPWHEYYLISKKKPFERNLVKNHSGEEGVEKYWDSIDEGGIPWKVENPPIGVPPLPSDEPLFNGKQFCFVTSYLLCPKVQTINLKTEGLSPYILDHFQPPIVVSEWYSCRWDCPATYECKVQLIGQDNKILDSFEFFNGSEENEKRHTWLKVTHEFINYGPGLTKILFYHGGVDGLFWAGHYGSKMAGACVYVKFPTARHTDS